MSTQPDIPVMFQLQAGPLSFKNGAQALLVHPEHGGLGFVGQIHERLWFMANYLPQDWPFGYSARFETFFEEKSLDEVIEHIRGTCSGYRMKHQTLVEDSTSFVDVDGSVLAPGEHNQDLVKLVEGFFQSTFWRHELVRLGFHRTCVKCDGRGYQSYIDQDGCSDWDTCYRCEGIGKIESQLTHKILGDLKITDGAVPIPEPDPMDLNLLF